MEFKEPSGENCWVMVEHMPKELEGEKSEKGNGVDDAYERKLYYESMKLTSWEHGMIVEGRSC